MLTAIYIFVILLVESTPISSHKEALMVTAWTLTPEKVLSRPEVESLLERAQERNQRDYTLLCIAANAGFRISEILHLTAEGFNGDRLNVTRRKKRNPKEQSVRIPASLAWIIGEYLQDRTTGYLFPGRAGACYINHLKGGRTKLCDGGHVSRREIQRRFELLLEGLGLNMKGRGIHALRHYAVTEFYGRTKDLRAAQIFAGHSSSTITEIYAAVRNMDELVDAMDVTL